MICMIASAMLMALGVKLYFNKQSGSFKVIFVLACLFFATYAIYLPAFLGEYDLLSALVGDLVNALQVITIDADVMRFYDEMKLAIDNSVAEGLYMLLLCAVHVALPLVSALTAVTVLLRCFSSAQLFFAKNSKRPLFVFSEMNERSRQLVKSLDGIKCDVVFTNSSHDSLNSEGYGRRKLIFKEEDISEISVKCKKGKNVYFFCISDDEDISLTQSLKLIEKYSKAERESQKNIHIYQFSRYQDFSVYIDSAVKENLDVRCVNEYELLIYNLLDKHPLLKYARSDIHVLLHGLSKINEIALRAIMWVGQLSGYSMKISVVGIGINEKIEDLKIRIPGLFTGRYNVNLYSCKSEKEIIDTVSERCSDANYVIVSEATDNETMDRAILLRRLFYKINREYNYCPPIFCYVKEPSKFNITQNLATAESNPKRKMSYDLTPFGSLDEVFSYRSLIDSDIEGLAKNVHLAYEEIFSDGEIDVNGALASYNVFEVNKRSNRANALHIRYKLNLLGLDYTDKEDAEEVDLKDYYTEEILDKLSRSEHDRWMAFLESEGWETSSKDDVYAYRRSEISKGRHQCPILKMHPYICEYEKLKDLSMDLEGKDTTVYDRELVLRIPDILGDKWGVSGKKHKITKLN